MMNQKRHRKVHDEENIILSIVKSVNGFLTQHKWLWSFTKQKNSPSIRFSRWHWSVWGCCRCSVCSSLFVYQEFTSMEQRNVDSKLLWVTSITAQIQPQTPPLSTTSVLFVTNPSFTWSQIHCFFFVSLVCRLLTCHKCVAYKVYHITTTHFSPLNYVHINKVVECWRDRALQLQYGKLSHIL